MKTTTHHWIQARVILRAAELNLTSYAIAQQVAAAGGKISKETVSRYLRGDAVSLTSERLGHVLRVLRLDITPEK